MTATVRDLILILQLFFPSDLSLHKALYIIGVILSLYPLLRLHLNQRRQPHQPSRTAWTTGILKLLVAAFQQEDAYPPTWAAGEDRGEEYAHRICDELTPLYMMLGLTPHDHAGPSPNSPFPSCIFCPVGDSNIIPTLRRRVDSKTVSVLDESFRWSKADLLIAHCTSCRVDYHRTVSHTRTITPAGPTIGDDRRLSSGLEAWNLGSQKDRSTSGEFSPLIPCRLVQFCGLAKRLYTRQRPKVYIPAIPASLHRAFSRRLLHFHKQENFACEAHPSTRLLAEAVRAAIGVNGGVRDAGMTHGCAGCTHLKRYRSDLIAEGAILGHDQEVAGLGNEGINAQNVDAPPAGSPRGYVRLAVMDGKTIKHRKCALDECENPLVNYKNGRFCETHINLRDICGIVPCGMPVRDPGALTCATEAHIQWQRQYENRRVIRRQQGGAHGVQGPTLQVSLEDLGDTPGDQVVHTFKAKSTYCLQTVQLACGFPIGWGKCYRSESLPQVLAILNRIWANHPNSRPSFIAYDDACSLLRHIVTQNPNDSWLATTKLIVEAWHYIGHRATDILCRLWCNPAPANGSQPDLVLVEEDANGVVHQTRAFNTETAEQLNSWLSGFESKLRQMSDVNYDFFVHALMMIYAEKVEKHVAEKDLALSDDFWAQALGS
ncbi:hypothetical protein B0H17DRAFT_1162093 [Mycena rosella]|uniref:CxC6 like cysteine cluster associated with KDZ domain-containing protein n=1 Tax=Mycena rosella TaxID=1033263 RepID=A0AAD7D0V0_MYCRO|nr:hypothetical protein B0H17DRAFT_1162093 [Mycena rosella]